MILDADAIACGEVLDAELCIVGAGAVGIAVALQFLRGPGRVILIESGRHVHHAASQALYEGEVADPALHPPLHTYRARRFGGSTTLWGGRCVPFDPVDFRARPWMPHSGWPVGRDELARWYPEANRLCEAGEFDYDAASAVPGGMRPVVAGLDLPNFGSDGIERFSLPTDFAARYAHRLAASESVRVLTGANCTGLVTDADGGRVTELHLRTLVGRRSTVRAARVVLALGGLETPRLLLASRGAGAPAGLGNRGGLVGRYYMCHIAGTSGRLRLNGPVNDVNAGYEVAQDGTYLRRRLHLTEAAQEREGVGNAVVRLHFPRIPDPRHGSGVLSALYLARRLLPYEYRKRLEEPGEPARTGRHLLNLIADPLAPATFAWTMLRKRRLAARKFPSIIVRPPGNVFTLDFHGEQEPNPESRVSLSGATDALGMPRLRVDWRSTERDVRTAQATFRLLADDLARSGRGTLDYDPQEVAADMLRDGAYGGHHIGTARMSSRAETGVVDPECRVHGVANLWIAGSAVFPTSSQANPTLTAVALALRLAAGLRREMGAPG